METIGTYLRRERELRDMSLAELSQVTRIPIHQLRRIEADALDELPGEVFVKGFLKSVAKTLGLDAEGVLKRLNRAPSAPPPTPAPVATLVSPDRGKRFGFAVALVILVILFTLAISIVLQPRQTDVPIELSSGPVLDLSSS